MAQPYQVEALTAVREYGIYATEITDANTLIVLEKLNWDANAFMQQWWERGDGFAGPDFLPNGPLGDNPSGGGMQQFEVAAPQIGPKRRDDGGDVSCTWSPALVCQDIGEMCEDNEVLKWGCCGCCTLTILILVIVLIACSVETIDSTEMGIAYNAPQAILDDEVKEEGLHGKPPFGYFIIWPRTHQTSHQTVTGLSKDGIVVVAQVAFQYKVQEKELMRLTKDYVDFDTYQQTLALQARSGIRNACMQYSAQEFQTMRAAVQSAMFTEVDKRLKAGNMDALVLDLQLTSIDRPKRYEDAVDAKENARNDIFRVTNLRAQLITQANTNLQRVVVQANKTLDTANTQAAVITKTAEAEAAVVLGRYKAQGDLYAKVRSERGLSSEGLLAYIGTRLIDELPSLTVGLPELAKVSYAAGLNSSSVRI